MFCPTCKDEFRPGFARCEACNVDLVDDLSAAESSPVDEASRGAGAAALLSMADYCGFFELDEARTARDRLRGASVRCDVVIREPPDADLSAPIKEEFWIRVEASSAGAAARVLGYDPVSEELAQEEKAETFDCGDCGKPVQAEEIFCPHCGASFEDD